jgi:hypothetical protein
VVTKLDRLGRSLAHLIDLSNDLQTRGVDLVVLDQGIDTSAAIGRMFFRILGAIAEHDFTTLRSYWMRNGVTGAGSWQGRRDLIHNLLSPAREQLRRT